MGGPNSGNWMWRNRKTVVEESLSLDIMQLIRECRQHSRTGELVGTLEWNNSSATVGFHLQIDTTNPTLILKYEIPDGPQHISIPLVTTSPHFGGNRWWGMCIASTAKGVCNRRVGKLYLPPGQYCFACRECHQLSYRSRQQSS